MKCRIPEPDESPVLQPGQPQDFDGFERFFRLVANVKVEPRDGERCRQFVTRKLQEMLERAQAVAGERPHEYREARSKEWIGNSVAAHCFTVDLNPASPKATVSSSADALVATHCMHPAGRLIERKTERLAVLIPGEGCSFHATYRSAGHRLHTVAVHEPFIALIPPAQPHVLLFRRACDLTILEIQPSLVDEKASDAGGMATWEAFPRHGILDPFLRAVGDTVKAALRSAAPPCDADLHAIADVLAAHLAVFHTGRRRAPGGNAALLHEMAARVKAFVRLHLDDRLPVDRLAAHVGLSPFHFARSFRTATGQSPHAFVTAERLARASVLLRETNVPLVQIAMNVGFQTQAHFTVLFHRVTGQTPRAYRVGHARLKR